MILLENNILKYAILMALYENIIDTHQFKTKGKFHFDDGAYTKPKQPDLYVLYWKSSYDVMLFMFQSRQQHFAEF
jgi:hypothetical protein